jgi:hypothetical protein
MKKLIVAFLFVNTIYAFNVEETFENQIDVFENTVFSSDELKLAGTEYEIYDLFINPNFPTWRDMYLSTSNGIYVNRKYSADWQKHKALSELFPNGLLEIKFEPNYTATLMMLAYDSDSIYISYNNGDSWSDITPDIEEEILFADFGPNYGANNQIYFITESGLYRKSISSGTITQLVESETPGSVHNFRYIRTNPSDAVFYVVNGNKLLKTENFGDSWFEHEFDSEIKDFEIKQKTATTGHLMVLTADNKMHYATTGFTFFDLDVPEDVNEIYAIDYIIYTDNGLYITYNNGDTWNHLDYDSSYISAVSDYDYALDVTLDSLYLINNNTLYRDYDLNEEFEEYMTGISFESAYVNEGDAVSKNLFNADDFAGNYVVSDAMLIVEEDVPENTSITYYMTADGENWQEITPNESFEFDVTGTVLKWKAVLATSDTSITPVLKGVAVSYGVEELSGCAGFSDVSVDDDLCPAIEYVVSQGIFEGYPDGTFKPDQSINRAETVKVIVEGFDYDILESDGTDLGFSDVGVDEWYMGYLKTAKESGIVEGYPDGTFKPSQTVNYAEMLKIFLETAEVSMSPPAEGEEWYEPYVNYASSNGFVVYEDVSEGMKRVDVAELFYEWSSLGE